MQFYFCFHLLICIFFLFTIFFCCCCLLKYLPCAFVFFVSRIYAIFFFSKIVCFHRLLFRINFVVFFLLFASISSSSLLDFMKTIVPWNYRICFANFSKSISFSSSFSFWLLHFILLILLYCMAHLFDTDNQIRKKNTLFSKHKNSLKRKYS